MHLSVWERTQRTISYFLVLGKCWVSTGLRLLLFKSERVQFVTSLLWTVLQPVGRTHETALGVFPGLYRRPPGPAGVLGLGAHTSSHIAFVFIQKLQPAFHVTTAKEGLSALAPVRPRVCACVLCAHGYLFLVSHLPKGILISFSFCKEFDGLSL